MRAAGGVTATGVIPSPPSPFAACSGKKGVRYSLVRGLYACYCQGAKVCLWGDTVVCVPGFLDVTGTWFLFSCAASRLRLVMLWDDAAAAAVGLVWCHGVVRERRGFLGAGSEETRCVGLLLLLLLLLGRYITRCGARTPVSPGPSPRPPDGVRPLFSMLNSSSLVSLD